MTSRAIARSTAAATSAVATHEIGASAGSGYATTPSRTTRSADHGALRFSRYTVGSSTATRGTAAARGGTDVTTVNDMTGTDLRTANLDPGADLQPDTVVLNGTNARDVVRVTRVDAQVRARGLKPALNVTGSTLFDTLRIQTLAGDDTVTLGTGVDELISPVIDLGADS